MSVSTNTAVRFHPLMAPASGPLVIKIRVKNVFPPFYTSSYTSSYTSRVQTPCEQSRCTDQNTIYSGGCSQTTDTKTLRSGPVLAALMG